MRADSGELWKVVLSAFFLTHYNSLLSTTLTVLFTLWAFFVMLYFYPLVFYLYPMESAQLKVVYFMVYIIELYCYHTKYIAIFNLDGIHDTFNVIN